jgi:hypothetical protein
MTLTLPDPLFGQCQLTNAVKLQLLGSQQHGPEDLGAECIIMLQLSSKDPASYLLGLTKVGFSLSYSDLLKSTK